MLSFKGNTHTAGPHSKFRSVGKDYGCLFTLSFLIWNWNRKVTARFNAVMPARNKANTHETQYWRWNRPFLFVEVREVIKEQTVCSSSHFPPPQILQVTEGGKSSRWYRLQWKSLETFDLELTHRKSDFMSQGLFRLSWKSVDVDK